MHAYLWDRYYGMCLAKYKHCDVVNSVAFNPKDSEMLVTTGDDYKIKVLVLDEIEAGFHHWSIFCVLGLEVEE